MTLHQEIALTKRHSAHNWEYADATVRAAATGFVPGDVGKLALQLSDSSLWMLTDDAPITWVQQTGGSAGAVTSVNGATGAVTLDADDIDDTSTTNKFTTAAEITKLGGIETGADVTDATNVNAAGATMNADTTLVGNGYFLDEDDMVSDSAAKVPSQQSVKAYVDAQVGGVGTGAPTDATYITQTPNGGLSAEQALSALATGLLKVTTTTGVLSTAAASDLPTAIDAAKIADGSVSNAEFQRLDGVTSAIQTQIDAKLTSPLTTKGDLTVYDTATTRLAVGSNGQKIVADSAQAKGVKWADDIATIPFIIDGGGSTITTGVKGFIPVDFTCTIVGVTVLADQSGSIVIDIWKDTYANYPPTVADTITASAKPTISAATKAQDTTLTGWTTAIAAGDILGFNVDSVTTLQRVTVALKVKKAA